MPSRCNDVDGIKEFFQKELKENILSFWMDRCPDHENGGFFNCFDNRGENLVSTDKYTWSQGRFLWLFSRLAMDKTGTFSASEKETFLSYASIGYQFIKDHCILDDYICAFVTDIKGTPKGDVLDASIYADCFAVLGFASYHQASGCAEAKELALAVYASIQKRLADGNFKSLPYPLSGDFLAHGIPMIMSNVAFEMGKLDQDYLVDAVSYTKEVQEDFVDDCFTIRETIRSDGGISDESLLCTHANPGHSLEDVWFMLDVADAQKSKHIEEKALKIARRALEIGWDEEFGGILHFTDKNGGQPAGKDTGTSTETLVKGGWGDKLWWVHSEALYTTLRCYRKTGARFFLNEFNKIKDYTFSHFPNPDTDIREWIQILDREGRPMDKVVALPVKDPFHIARDFYRIIELLS